MYGEISTTIVSYPDNSINLLCIAFLKVVFQVIPMDKKVFTVATVTGPVALLNYFEKIMEKESMQIILAVVCVLTKMK